jgi:hypothetical protein
MNSTYNTWTEEQEKERDAFFARVRKLELKENTRLLTRNKYRKIKVKQS